MKFNFGANNNTRAPPLFQTLQLFFGSHAKTFSPEQSEQSSVVKFFSLAEEGKKTSCSKDDKNLASLVSSILHHMTPPELTEKQTTTSGAHETPPCCIASF